MIDTRLFGQMIKDTGYSFYSVVPFSFLKDLINYAVNECDYVMDATTDSVKYTQVVPDICSREE